MRRTLFPFVILIIIVIGVIFGLYRFGQNKTSIGETLFNTNKSSGWQAVFLTNGQVYFGKLAKSSGQFVTLRTIYYLQLPTSPTPGTEALVTPNTQSQISLVKFGNELHGPTDEMRINRDHILFIEEMKSDAKVVRAIEEYQNNGSNQSQLQTSPSPTASY